eukprot:9155311-Pyramimonas_sp.AAC.1
MIGRISPGTREQQVRDWRGLLGTEWNAAISGNSSLVEVFLCALSHEIAGWMKLPTGNGMLDIKGFYDGVEWDVLVLAALRSGYPPAILYMELAQCVAARTLEHFGALREPFIMERSTHQGLMSRA